MTTHAQALQDYDGGLTPEGHGGVAGLPPAVVHSVQEKKLQVFTEQWGQSQLPVRAYLASFLGNSVEVDDCLQEVALLAWNKGPWNAGHPDFLGYCLACAKRVALAARRRQWDRRIELLSPETASSLADTVALQEHHASHEPAERMAALRVCLAALKPEQRDLVEARYAGKNATVLQGLAEKTGSTMDCLYKKLERLREILRKCMTRRQGAAE